MKTKECPACRNMALQRIVFRDRNFFSCPECRLQWGNLPFQTFSDRINSKITSHYLSPKSIGIPSKYPPYRQFFDTLRKWESVTNLKVLDVGCGNGIFINECLRKGLRVAGVEASPGFSKMIPAEVRDRIFFESIEEYVKKKRDLFDVITFWDSFHYLERPFDLLNCLRKILTQNGIVYIRTNNRNDIYNWATDVCLRWSPLLGRKLFVECFGEYSRWNFSFCSMSGLLDKNGWQILSSQFTDTPAFRLTPNLFLATSFNIAYRLNRILKGGKAANYYIKSKE